MVVWHFWSCNVCGSTSSILSPVLASNVRRRVTVVHGGSFCNVVLNVWAPTSCLIQKCDGYCSCDGAATVTGCGENDANGAGMQVRWTLDKANIVRTHGIPIWKSIMENVEWVKVFECGIQSMTGHGMWGRSDTPRLRHRGSRRRWLWRSRMRRRRSGLCKNSNNP